jgi:hypothetical protein
MKKDLTEIRELDRQMRAVRAAANAG